MKSVEIESLVDQLRDALRICKHDEDCIDFVANRFRSLGEQTHVAIEINYPAELAEVVAQIRDQHQAASGVQLRACIDAWTEVWRLQRQVLMLPIRHTAQ